VLALLYSLMGRYSAGLLVVRIEETIAGAVIGSIAAAFILPMRTSGKISTSLCSLLLAVSEFLTQLPSGHALRTQVRALDSLLQQVRGAAEPLTRSLLPIGRDTVSLTYRASALVFYTRQLARAGMFADLTEPELKLLKPAVEALAQDARSTARSLERGGRAEWIDATPQLEGLLQLRLQRGVAEAELAAHWLIRVNDTLKEVAALTRAVAPAALSARQESA
jgi:hypothetical protein